MTQFSSLVILHIAFEKQERECNTGNNEPHSDIYTSTIENYFYDVNFRLQFILSSSVGFLYFKYLI